jgi:DNA-binding LacI/PurR family transcriptional regulator
MQEAPDLPPLQQRRAIARAAGLHVRSVGRAFRGEASAGVMARVVLAARELGLSPPKRTRAQSWA